MRNNISRGVLVVCLCIIGASRTSADLIFTLSPSTMAANPGGSAIFSGTLSNTGPDLLFLNGIDFAFDGGAGAFLSGDSNPFFANIDGIYPSGFSQSNTPIFGVNVDISALPGTYTGTATIKGGPNDPSDNDPLASQAFTVNVLATPEPGTLALYLAGGFVVYLKVRRPKRA
jgi:hypothetical protein